MSQRRPPEILVTALSVSRTGGSRSYVVNLIRELERDDRGFRVTFLVPPGEFTRMETRRVAIRPVRLPESGFLRTLCRVGYEEFLLPLRAGRYDLLYCLADLAPVFAFAPTVVALRNLNIYDRRFYDIPRLRTLERLARAGLPHARRIVFPTRAAADWIGGRLRIPEERIVVVPHGVDAAAFGADAPAAVEVPYVFTPAAVERHKNLGVLIESLPHLRDTRVQAWIAGTYTTDPEYVADLRARAAELGLEERVRFLGIVAYEEILGLYRGSAALVFPSLLETFGHPLLEAMLAGTPVVASDIPAFREVAGDAALYFEPEDPVALARSIERVLDAPDATAERVARGAARVGEFTWKRSVDALCEVFAATLADAR